MRVLLVGTMALLMMILSSVDVDGDLTTTNLPSVVQTASEELRSGEKFSIVKRRILASVPRALRRRLIHRVQLLAILHRLDFRVHVPAVRGP